MLVLTHKLKRVYKLKLVYINLNPYINLNLYINLNPYINLNLYIMSNKEFNNPTFKKNVTDIEKGMIVKSIYLKKKTKMDRDMQTLVWQYYRHRGSLNVNDVIKKYGRDSLVINYSITPNNCTDDIHNQEYMNKLQKEIESIIEYNIDPYTLSSL